MPSACWKCGNGAPEGSTRVQPLPCQEARSEAWHRFYGGVQVGPLHFEGRTPASSGFMSIFAGASKCPDGRTKKRGGSFVPSFGWMDWSGRRCVWSKLIDWPSTQPEMRFSKAAACGALCFSCKNTFFSAPGGRRRLRIPILLHMNFVCRCLILGLGILLMIDTRGS